MKKFLIFIGAFVGTSCVMMCFEYANHLMYPFPEGLDTNNLQAIQEFGKTMPTFAFVMILLGWFFGTILGIFILQKYLQVNIKNKIWTIYIFALTLTLLAIWNNYMYIGLGNRLWFELLTPIFFLLTTFLYINLTKQKI
jgi:hypothetical protein